MSVYPGNCGAKGLATIDLFRSQVLPKEKNPKVLTLLGDSAGTPRILRALGHTAKIYGAEYDRGNLASSKEVIERLKLKNIYTSFGDVTDEYQLLTPDKVDLVDMDWCHTLSPQTLDKTFRVCDHYLKTSGSIIVAGIIGHGNGENSKPMVRVAPCTCGGCSLGKSNETCEKRISYMANAHAVEDYTRKHFNSKYHLHYSVDYMGYNQPMLYCYLRPMKGNHVHCHVPRCTKEEMLRQLKSCGAFTNKQIAMFATERKVSDGQAEFWNEGSSQGVAYAS